MSPTFDHVCLGSCIADVATFYLCHPAVGRSLPQPASPGQFLGVLALPSFPEAVSRFYPRTIARHLTSRFGAGVSTSWRTDSAGLPRIGRCGVDIGHR